MPVSVKLSCVNTVTLLSEWKTRNCQNSRLESTKRKVKKFTFSGRLVTHKVACTTLILRFAYELDILHATNDMRILN